MCQFAEIAHLTFSLPFYKGLTPRQGWQRGRLLLCYSLLYVYL
jgi:hypothetical protein